MMETEKVKKYFIPVINNMAKAEEPKLSVHYIPEINTNLRAESSKLGRHCACGKDKQMKISAADDARTEAYSTNFD
jgi:hypothetical protein